VQKSVDQAKSVYVVRLDTEEKATVKTTKELGIGIARSAGSWKNRR